MDDGVDGNAPPSASAGEYTVEEGGLLSVEPESGVLANDSDPGGQPLTAKLAEGPLHAERFELRGDGSFVYQHDGSEESSDHFSYVANDGIDDSAPVTVDIKILPINDPPVISGVEPLTIPAGAPFVLDVSHFQIDDPDNRFPDDFSILIEEGEDFSLAGSTITPRAGYSGLLTLIVRVSDGAAQSDSYSLTVSVHAVNQPPALVQPIPAQEGRSGALFGLNVRDYFEDPDGDVLRFQAQGLPSGLVLDGIKGDITGTLPAVAGADSSYRVTLSVSDPTGATAQGAFDLVVLANRGPTVQPIGDQRVEEGAAVQISLASYFADPDGDSLRFSASGLPESLTCDANGNITGTPTQADTRQSHSVQVTADDGHGGTTNASFALIVIDVNEAPVVTNPLGEHAAVEGEALSIATASAFSDPDGDPLEFTAEGLPASLAIDPQSGVISGSPTNEDALLSPHAITVTARDPDGASAADRLVLAIQNVNQPPAPVQSISDQSAQVGVPFALDISRYFSDPDGDPLHFSARGLSDSFVLDAASGNLAGTPLIGENGQTYNVNVTVADGGGTAATGSFQLLVLAPPANQPPIALSGCRYTAQEAALVGRLNGDDPDGDPAALRFRVISAPTKGEVVLLDAARGDFQYTPGSTGPRGKDSFRFEVTDSAGASASAEQLIVIHPKVMPLGDSITAGYLGTVQLPDDQKIGYRKRLYELLNNGGFRVDFVGSRRYGGALMDDPDSEGWGGMTDNWFAGQVYGWLELNPADVVLVHIGSNGVDPSPADVERLLNEIDRWENDSGVGNPVTVLLARIIDQNPSHPDIMLFNDAVQQMAEARSGDRVRIVDQQRALWNANGEPDPTLYDDYLHPNPAGYNRMADTWFESLRTVLDRCP